MTALDLDTLTLAQGKHDRRSEGVCLLEAVAWLAGETHTDRPRCVSPVIAEFGRSWNDALEDPPRTALLKPLIPLMIGTATTEADEETRAWMCVDWLARVQTPAWLRLAGLTSYAEALEACARLVDAATARDAQPALDAARDAAWAAAEAAARAAARDAARDAARAAAGAAARDAAGAAAWAAARAAARDAAWAAARDAAWAAAWAAARAAARAALHPTVEALQQAAVQLLRDMCAVGRAA